jgi:hypothetical protein
LSEIIDVTGAGGEEIETPGSITGAQAERRMVKSRNKE